MAACGGPARLAQRVKRRVSGRDVVGGGVAVPVAAGDMHGAQARGGAGEGEGCCVRLLAADGERERCDSGDGRRGEGCYVVVRERVAGGEVQGGEALAVAKRTKEDRARRGHVLLRGRRGEGVGVGEGDAGYGGVEGGVEVGVDEGEGAPGGLGKWDISFASVGG